jgi:hypothetical protein
MFSIRSPNRGLIEDRLYKNAYQKYFAKDIVD